MDTRIFSCGWGLVLISFIVHVAMPIRELIVSFLNIELEQLSVLIIIGFVFGIINIIIGAVTKESIRR